MERSWRAFFGYATNNLVITACGDCGEGIVMRFVVVVLASVGIGALALADPPTTAPGQAAASSAAAAPAASAAIQPATPPAGAAPTASVPATPDAAAAEAERQEKHFLSEGYKIEMHHGDKYFCHREEMLGSRLGGEKHCSTAQQLTATEAQAKELVERSQRQQAQGPSGK